MGFCQKYESIDTEIAKDIKALPNPALRIVGMEIRDWMRRYKSCEARRRASSDRKTTPENTNRKMAVVCFFSICAFFNGLVVGRNSLIAKVAVYIYLANTVFHLKEGYQNSLSPKANIFGNVLEA